MEREVNIAKGYVHSVESFGTLDGPRIRYVIFLQGCGLRCLYCHNPDTWNMSEGKILTVTDVMNDIKKYYSFIKNGGVTISGGEPMLQPEFVLEILKSCKKLGLHTAIDTSGAVHISLSAMCIDEADLILLDIKTLDPSGFIKLTGNSIDNSLVTLDYCERIGKPVWIRHVLVPGITLDYEKLNELADFLSSYKCIQRVELLPFHKMGEYKWKECGLDYKLEDTPAPTRDEIEKASEIFKGYGLKLN